jgi:hypothetical protein
MQTIEVTAIVSATIFHLVGGVLKYRQNK